MSLTAEALDTINRVIDKVDGHSSPYCQHKFNILRWLVAYDYNEEEVVKQLKRHLIIREEVDLEGLASRKVPVENDIEKFVPITFLGRNRETDNKIVLYEYTGEIDINGLVSNVKMSAFIKIKLRMMETLLEKVIEEEKRTGEQSGGVLVMNLNNLSFSTKLISVLTGPYRIMWGTLFDHYPQLLRQIIVINAPSYVNMLHSAFSPFLPNDYKEKITIRCEGSECLQEYIDFGGEPENHPESPFPSSTVEMSALDTVDVPAGRFTIQKFEWVKDEVIEFFLQNSSNFHYFVFYSEVDTRDVSLWREVTVGCERPALNQTDHWHYKIPKTGFYYIRYANEGSWLFGITINVKHVDSATGEALTPIETFNL